MNIKKLSLAALIIATIIGAWYALLVFIIVAHYIEEITDGDNDPLFGEGPEWLFVLLVLTIISISTSWFKQKIGSLLVITFSLLLIFSDLDAMHVGKWPEYVLLISGIVLFNNAYLLENLTPALKTK